MASPHTTESESEYFLNFKALKTEEALENLSLKFGGTIGASAARHGTDIALTGSQNAVTLQLTSDAPVDIRIPIPFGLAAATSGRDKSVDIDQSICMTIMNTRIVAGINGTLGTSMSGQAAPQLARLFANGGKLAAIPLYYSDWMDPSATISASDFHVTNSGGEVVDVNFVPPTESYIDAHATAEAAVERWTRAGWDLRQNALRYAPAPTLHKMVAVVPAGTGINESRYDMLANIADMALPWTWQTLESMLENTTRVELAFDKDRIHAFMEDTARPGLRAAKHVATIGSAISIFIASQFGYHEDGKTTVDQTGVTFKPYENWLGSAPRGPNEVFDCDNVTVVSHKLLSHIGNAPPDVRDSHRHINAAFNALAFHTPGIGVLGASGAEASGVLANGESAPVQGHAATFLLPSLHLIAARDAGTAHRLTDGRVVEPDADRRAKIASAMYEALFPASFRATLPEDDQALLHSLDTARKGGLEFEAKVVEGTSPVNSKLATLDADEASQEAIMAKKDDAAFQKYAPNASRGARARAPTRMPVRPYAHSPGRIHAHRHPNHARWRQCGRQQASDDTRVGGVHGRQKLAAVAKRAAARPGRGDKPIRARRSRGDDGRGRDSARPRFGELSRSSPLSSRY